MFLLGKGGVGRSTLAAALGLLAARQGRRAIVVEVSGRGDVPRLFGGSAPAGDQINVYVKLTPHNAVSGLTLKWSADNFTTSNSVTAVIGAPVFVVILSLRRASVR